MTETTRLNGINFRIQSADTSLKCISLFKEQCRNRYNYIPQLYQPRHIEQWRLPEKCDLDTMQFMRILQFTYTHWNDKSSPACSKTLCFLLCLDNAQHNRLVVTFVQLSQLLNHLYLNNIRNNLFVFVMYSNCLLP